MPQQEFPAIISIRLPSRKDYYSGILAAVGQPISLSASMGQKPASVCSLAFVCAGAKTCKRLQQSFMWVGKPYSV